MKHPALSPAPANPTGSKIILHQQRAAALTSLMLMMRAGVEVLSRACNGSISVPTGKKGIE